MILPRSVTKTGALAKDIWLVGTVVRVRTHNGNEDGEARKDDGKGKGKGKKERESWERKKDNQEERIMRSI